jgi:MFS family permease
MVAADLWRITLAGVLPLVDQHLAAVYAVAFGLAAGSVFFNPAAASVLPSVVADEELVAANSGLWSAAVISQIALAPLAGTVVAAWGVTPAFLVNVASFAVSAVVLAGLRLVGCVKSFMQLAGTREASRREGRVDVRRVGRPGQEWSAGRAGLANEA